MNNYAVSSDGIATALQDSASALMEGGNNLEQATALVAAANRVVQDPNSVGSALRTISLRLRGTSVEVLEEMGEETDGVAESTSKLQEKLKALTGVDILTDAGAYKDTYTILKEIGAEWQNISDIDKAATLELMAGKNRANTLSAILSNMEDLTGAYETALNAEGSALRENEAFLDSIEGRITKFTSALQTMWMNLINSDTIKSVVDAGTILLQTFTNIQTTIRTIPTILAAIVAFNLGKTFAQWAVAAVRVSLANSALAISEKAVAKAKTETAKAAALKEVAQAKENLTTAQNTKQNLANALSFKGLGKSLKAFAGTAVGKITILGVVLSIVKSAYDKYKQTQQESAASAQQQANSIDELNQSLQDYKDQVSDLRSQLDNGNLSEAEAYNVRKQLIGIQDELIQKYGKEAEGINLVTGAIEEQSSALDELAQKNAQQWLNDSNKKNKMWGFISTDSAVDQAVEAVETTYDTFSGFGFNTWHKAFGDLDGTRWWGEHQEASEKAYDEYVSFVTSLGGSVDQDKLHVRFEDITRDQLDDYYTQIQNWLRSYGKEHNLDFSALIGEYEEEKTDKLGENYDTHKANYDTYLENTAIASYTEAYGKILDAEDEFLKASTDEDRLSIIGDYQQGVAEAFQQAGGTIDVGGQLIINENQGDTSMQKYFLGMQDKFNQAEFELKVKLNEDSLKTDISNIIKQGGKDGLSALDDIAIKDMISRGLNEEGAMDVSGQYTQEQIAGLAALQSHADNAGISIENLVNTLVSFGLIAGQPVEKAAESVEAVGQAYSTLATAVDEYADVNTILNEVTQNNIKISQEQYDTLKGLIGTETEFAECIDATNGYVVKNTALLKKLVAQKRKEQAADVKLSKSQAQLEYYELYKKMRQLTNGQSKLTAAVRNEVNALYVQMNALEKTIARYSRLEQQLLGTADAFTVFEDAQNADSATDYISSIESMTTALGEAFSTGELGTEAVQAAIKGLVPESVYADLDTVDEKMDAIYKYFKEGKLNQYIDIQFNEDGAIESAEMKLGNLRKFVEDGLANGVFTGEDWQHFDLSEDINSLEEFAEKMGVTKEIAFAFFEAIEDHDIEWLNGDYSTLFDKLIPSREDIEKLGQEMQDKFDQSPIDFTVRPKVSWEKMYEAGYEEFKDGASGDYATVYSSGYSSENFGLYDENGQTYEILLTPILPNGDVIEDGKLVDYVNEQLSKGKTIDQLDVYIGSYKTQSEADQAAEQLHQMQEQYDKTKSNYNLENDIYKTTSALADLEHKLANGEITLAEYSKQYNALMADQAKNTEAATEKVFGYIDQNEEANQAVEEQRQVVEGLTTKLNNLNQQYEQAENRGLDTTQLKADIEETKSLLDQATQKLGEVLQAKYALGSEPTVVEIQTVLDDIAAKKKEIQDELGYTLDVHYEFNEETQEYTIKAGIQETDELKEYISLLNDEHELNVYLGSTTAETQEGLDKVVKTIDDAKTALAELEKVEPDVNTETIQASLDSVKSKAQEVATALNGLSKTITIEVEEQVKIPTRGGHVGSSGGHYASAYGNAFASGHVGLQKAEHNSLLGELGAEMVVDPHSGRYYTVGDHGAEMVDLPKDAIIFNHKQTEGLLKHGHINSRGKAYAEGNAHVTFYGQHSSKDQWKSTGYSSWDDPTWAAADALSNAAGDVSDAAEDVVDFIEIKLTEIENKISKVTGQLELYKDNALTSAIANKNAAYDELVNLEKDKAETYYKAASLYNTKAAALLQNIPAEYRDMAQNGAISIADFVGESESKIADAINKYREYANKADESITSYYESMAQQDQYRLDQFNDIADDFDNQIEQITAKADWIDSQISLAEESGQRVAASYYDALLDVSMEQQKKLQEKRDALQGKLSTVTEGTDAWYEMKAALNEVDAEIMQCNIDIEGFQNSINDLKWDNLEKLIDRFDALDSELSHLFDRFTDNDDVVDEFGNWTDKGIAAMGVAAQQMEVAQYKAQEYGKAIEDLKTDYNKGLYSQDEYDEKLAELTENQWESIEAYESAKDALVDLNKTRIDAVKDSMQKEIDAYKELIDKQKESLDAEKDLHDFERDVADQTKEIATLERKIAALRGDSSASAAAQRKQLEAELLEAKANLEETFYDRSIQNQQTALDKEYENYEETMNDEMEALDKWLKDEEAVIAESLNTVKANTDVVLNEMHAISEQYGIKISDSIVTPWENGSNAISGYKDSFVDLSDTFSKELDKIIAKQQELQLAAEAAAKSAVATVQKDSTRENPSTNPPKQPTNNNPAKTEEPKKEEPKKTEVTKGQTVTVDKDATNFSDKSGNKHMASFVPGGSYTVMQTSGNQVLIGKGGTATGWVNKEDLQGYAKGTTSVKDSQWAWIDEMGEELVLHAGSDGKLAYLTKGSAVVPHDLTNKLIDLVADPTQTLENSRPIISAPHITNNEINVNMEFGSVVNIEHVDNDTVPNLTKAVEKQMDKYLKSLNANIRKYVR